MGIAIPTRRDTLVQRVILVVVVVVAMTALFVWSHSVLAAGETFSSPADKTTFESQTLPIIDLQINGSGDEQLDMNLHANNGDLRFDDAIGLTFDGPSTGSTLQFSGTRSAINAALLTLEYRSNTTGIHTVEATLGGSDGDVYNPDNGHVYQVVAAGGEGISWNDAKTAAEGLTHNGANGYLATITSEEESDFIVSRLSDDGWMGASDAIDEGDWQWATGPEAGTSLASGTFTNWGSNQPDDYLGIEDCSQIVIDGGGVWNDLPCSTTTLPYYVVEFGTEGNMPTVASTSFRVTVEEAPAIDFTNLSPADDSKVAPTDTLSITFNQPMETSEGYIRVYDAADDSLVAEVGSYEPVSVENDHTFIYKLPVKLTAGNSYYVHVTDSGLEGLVDYYHGFEDKTTWNFTIVDPVTQAVEDNAPNNGDANNDGVADSEQSNVTSAVNPITGNYTTVAVSDTCELQSVSGNTESTAVKDAGYDYKTGLVGFDAACSTSSMQVKVYQYGVTADGLVLRKHNPNTNAYFTIKDAVLETQTIGGQTVAVATYVIEDNGELDLNPVVGQITDPVGLANLVVGVPNTGLGGNRTN